METYVSTRVTYVNKPHEEESRARGMYVSNVPSHVNHNEGTQQHTDELFDGTPVTQPLQPRGYLVI